MEILTWCQYIQKVFQFTPVTGWAKMWGGTILLGPILPLLALEADNVERTLDFIVN